MREMTEIIKCDVCNKVMAYDSKPIDICGDCYQKAKGIEKYKYFEKTTRLISYAAVGGIFGFLVGLLIN